MMMQRGSGSEPSHDEEEEEADVMAMAMEIEGNETEEKEQEEEEEEEEEDLLHPLPEYEDEGPDATEPRDRVRTTFEAALPISCPQFALLYLSLALSIYSLHYLCLALPVPYPMNTCPNSTMILTLPQT